MLPIKAKFKDRLGSKFSARGHMSLILLATFACGIIASKMTLYWTEIGPVGRYGFAVLFSYGMFFLLMNLWLRWMFGSRQDYLDADDFIDAVDLPSDMAPAPWHGGGGNFSGGGAQASWAPAEVNSEGASATSESSSLLSKANIGDIDEIGAIIALCVLIAAVFGSATYVVYQAPELMLEAAFEFLLAAGLFRRAKRISNEGWAMPIFKGTWVPFVIVFFVSLGFGSWIHANCPEARSYSEMKQICLSKK
jgi:hypothetical protein